MSTWESVLFFVDARHETHRHAYIFISDGMAYCDHRGCSKDELIKFIEHLYDELSDDSAPTSRVHVSIVRIPKLSDVELQAVAKYDEKISKKLVTPWESVQKLRFVVQALVSICYLTQTVASSEGFTMDYFRAIEQRLRRYHVSAPKVPSCSSPRCATSRALSCARTRATTTMPYSV